MQSVERNRDSGIIRNTDTDTVTVTDRSLESRRFAISGELRTGTLLSIECSKIEDYEITTYPSPTTTHLIACML